MSQPKPKNQSAYSFPLGGLFQLVTLFCVLLGMMGWLIRTQILHPSVLTGSIAGGAGVGALFGFLIGLYHYRRIRGVITGVFAGMVFGALTAPLGILSLEAPWQTIVASCASAFVMIGLAALYRQLNGCDPVSKNYDFSRILKDDAD